jgi:hypothetical protein
MSHFVISDDLKNLFLQRLEESVTQGDTIQYVKSRKSTTTIRNGEGEIIRTQETISEERNTTLMKTTPQAIPILDRALSVEAAMNLLMREGYVIVDPTKSLDDDGHEKPKGLSEDTITLIKCRILGIEPTPIEERILTTMEEFD